MFPPSPPFDQDLGPLPIATVCALLWLAGCTGLALRRHRIPVLAWLIGPVLVPGIGGLFAWSFLADQAATVGAATPDVRPATAATGLADGFELLTLAWWLGVLLAVLGCWGAALSTLRGEPGDRWQPVPAMGIGGAMACVAAATMAIAFAVRMPALSSVLVLSVTVPMAACVARASPSGAAGEVRATHAGAVLWLAVWTQVAAGLASFGLGISYTAMAIARASIETRKAMLANGVSLGPELAAESAVAGVLVAGVAAVAWNTWLRDRDRAVQWGHGLALAGLLLVPVGLALPGTGPASHLWATALDALGFPGSEDLQIPMVAQVTDPGGDYVEVYVSRRDLVLRGEWVFDLQLDEPLPAKDSAAWQLWERRLRENPSRSVILVQVDRRVPWRILGPILEEIRAAGWARIELVAMDRDRLGIVVLEDPPVPTPSADESLEQWLARRDS